MLSDRAKLPILTASSVLGWVLLDLAVFATNCEPYLALDLVPASALAVAIGLGFGSLWAVLPRLIAVASGVAGLVTLVASFVHLPIRASLFFFFWAVLLLLLASAGAALAARRGGFGPVRSGLVAGVLASCGFTFARTGFVPVVAVLAGAALLGASASVVRRRGLSRSLLAVAVLAPVAFVAVVARAQLELRRPDRSLRASAAASGHPSVVLIVLDTVRASHLAPYGYRRVTTPGIDAFVRERASTYTETRATSSWTLPSHASMFTGLLPSEHGADHPRAVGDAAVSFGRWPADALRTDVPTLAERLSGAGYHTAAIVANDVYLAHEFGVDRGFEHYDDRRPTRWDRWFLALVQMAGWRPETGHTLRRDARRITDLALSWIDGRRDDGPFFLFLNYNDAHWPYIPPAPFDRAFEPERPQEPLSAPGELEPLLYDRELLFLDAQVTRLLRGLDSRGLLDGAAVVITSDHGEAFGEHGLYRHDLTLYEEVLRVPLYVKPAGRRGPQAPVSRHATGAEVCGIVLRAAGCDPGPDPPPDGSPIAEWYRSPELTGLWRRKDVDVDRDLVAWLDGSRKIVVDSKGKVQVFDLARDPTEGTDLSDHGAGDEAARERARAWWTAHPPLGRTHGEDINPDLRERMRALGYVD